MKLKRGFGRFSSPQATKFTEVVLMFSHSEQQRYEKHAFYTEIKAT